MADTESSKNYTHAYGKRPLWQWIVIYLIIAAILYGAVYYFFLSKRGGYQYTSPQQSSPSTQAQPAQSTGGY